MQSPVAFFFVVDLSRVHNCNPSPQFCCRSWAETTPLLSWKWTSFISWWVILALSVLILFFLMSFKMKEKKNRIFKLIHSLMELKMCFSRWRWSCLRPLCTRRRLLTCSHLQSALPITTFTLCIWSPWLMCCRSSCLLKVPKVKKKKKKIHLNFVIKQ